MKGKALTLLASLLAGVFAAEAAPAQGRHGDRQARRETPRQHQARHRNAPPVERWRGPQDYRPGQRPPALHRPPGFDRRNYERNYRAERRFRRPHYVRPRGWFSHRWIFGDILPQVFWSRSYWILDFWLYGLPIPPAGCVWVRYGNDALLVDRETGEILQVIYQIFY